MRQVIGIAVALALGALAFWAARRDQPEEWHRNPVTNEPERDEEPL